MQLVSNRGLHNEKKSGFAGIRFGSAKKKTLNAPSNLASHAMLIKDLQDDYHYAMKRKLRADPIETGFLQYRQIKG